MTGITVRAGYRGRSVQEDKMDFKAYEAILDSIDSPIVFVDNDHIIRYLNKAAKVRYEKRGYSDLRGKSLFDCHNPASTESIKQIHERLLTGETAVFLKVNKDQERITVVGVRSAAGQLLGYYEWFQKSTEPTVGGDGKPAPNRDIRL
jgi:PAS domain S-box-containing protein